MNWLDLFHDYGYLLLFLTLMFEGQPFMLLAGFLVSLHYFNFWLVVLIGIPAIIIGDFIFHSLALKYGRKILNRFGRFLFLTPGVIVKMENFLATHGQETVFITKFIYGMGRNFLIVTGLSGRPFKTFWKEEVFGSALSMVLFTFIGYYLGESYRVLEGYLKGFGYGLIILIIVIILLERLGLGHFFKRSSKHD